MAKYTLPSKNLREKKPRPVERPAFSTFILLSERAYSLLFFFVEMLIGAFALGVFCFWAWKIFITRDGSYVADVRRTFEHIHSHWIGYLFVLPFIFFRIIVIKVMTMSSFGSSKFDGKASFIVYRD